MIINEFDRKVCEDCIRINKIKNTEDLKKRWMEPWDKSIAYWFVRMDFIPAHWFKILYQCLKEKEAE